MVSKNALVLFSGGLDSTACVKFYKDLSYNVSAIFVDYGQRSRFQEYKSVCTLSKIFKIEVKMVSLKGIEREMNGEILGRNLLLLSTALFSVPFEIGVIAMGLHSGTNYWDCSQTFVNKSNELLSLHTGGKISLGVPFIEWNKFHIMKFLSLNKVDIEYTYSCELGLEQPCGNCVSCQDIISLNASKK